MVAHTGIAATLLINGTTVHRQFGIPLNTDEASVSKLQPDSEMVRKIITADVIIWDEATMSDKRVYMCVDRLLRHLCNPNEPFGGKVMLLGGDWRQLLPVVRTLDMANVVNYTLKRCHLWKHFHTLRLTQNMRAEDPDGEFADYIRLLGEADDSVMNPDDLTVRLPPEICLETEQEVVNFVYGGDVEDIDKVKKVGLLTTENKDTEELNEMVCQSLISKCFHSGAQHEERSTVHLQEYRLGHRGIRESRLASSVLQRATFIGSSSALAKAERGMHRHSSAQHRRYSWTLQWDTSPS